MVHGNLHITIVYLIGSVKFLPNRRGKKFMYLLFRHTYCLHCKCGILRHIKFFTVPERVCVRVKRPIRTVVTSGLFQQHRAARSVSSSDSKHLLTGPRLTVSFVSPRGNKTHCFPRSQSLCLHVFFVVFYMCHSDTLLAEIKGSPRIIS